MKKHFLIIGGSGSLGSQVVSDLYALGHNITVLSRGELLQKKLKARFPNIKCVIGDVKDAASLEAHFDGKYCVMNFAALKHVDICEDNVQECINTNLKGGVNVANLAKKYGVRRCIFTSTDKAVLPINAYGMAKALTEKYLQSLNAEQTFFGPHVLPSKYKIYRWGNVLGSRGSVLHLFRDSLLAENTVYITDATMTRFWITLPQVSKFILETYEEVGSDEILIPPMKACRVIDLASAVARHLGFEKYNTVITGIRPGEKIHECLRSGHDSCLRSDNCDQLTSCELDELVKGVLA